LPTVDESDDGMGGAWMAGGCLLVLVLLGAAVAACLYVSNHAH